MKIKKKNKGKWSKRYENTNFTFWNPWSYSIKMSTANCKSLNIDITGLTELHNNQKKPKFQNKNWICSELADVKDRPDSRCGDPIIEQDDKECTDQGKRGDKDRMGTAERPNFQLVCCSDIIQELNKLLMTVPKQDYIVLGGDFNCQLQRHATCPRMYW